jgi:S1-C subfamily serine protease
MPVGSPRSSLPAALAAGVASALVVCALFLAAGAFEDDPRPRPASSATTVASVRAVYARSREAVVLVDHRPPGTPPRTGPPTREDGVATGSGFVVDAQGHIVTNAHVVAGNGQTTVQFGSDADPVRARVVGRDPSTDLALLKIDARHARGLTPLPLGDSSAVRVGDEVLAIGSPFGLERTLTVGVVSAADRTIDAPNGAQIRRAVQTDAAINPGNSGGPLLDAAGRVIGVNSQGRAGGIAFAVPVDTVKDVVAALRRDGRVIRPYLGVTTRVLTAAIARERNLPVRRGALVSGVEADGPAARAGLRRGDVIVAVDGRRIRRPEDVADAVERRRPGDTAGIAVQRGERRIQLRAELAERRD